MEIKLIFIILFGFIIWVLHTLIESELWNDWISEGFYIGCILFEIFLIISLFY